MSTLSAELVVIAVLIVLNGLFSMAEMAVVAARRVRLQARARRGHRGARVALALADDPADFLAAAQVGITLVGILAGAFGGAGATTALAETLRGVPLVGVHATGLAFVLVVGAITLVTVVIGELVPKRVALAYSESIAAWVAPPMRAFSRVAAPLVRGLSFSAGLFLRALRVPARRGSEVSEDEIRLLMEKGAQSGAIERSEHALLEGVFGLGDLRAGSVMTPRREIVWLDVNADNAEIARRIGDSNFSRFPVADGDLDHVIGVVRAKDLLPRCIAGEEPDLRAAMLKPIFVPESLPALRLLDTFRRARPHVALVLDEYGGLLGLVTIGDLIEAVVGALPEVGEEVHEEAVKRGDGSWLVDGAISVERLFGLLDRPLPSEEERGSFSTAAGLVLWRLGRLPAVGDRLESHGLRFEVLDLDGRRIDKLLVEELPSAGATES